ncbi:unnamed protein product [Scytosiphon promiscuus]
MADETVNAYFESGAPPRGRSYHFPTHVAYPRKIQSLFFATSSPTFELREPLSFDPLSYNKHPSLTRHYVLRSVTPSVRTAVAGQPTYARGLFCAIGAPGNRPPAAC